MRITICDCVTLLGEIKTLPCRQDQTGKVWLALESSKIEIALFIHKSCFHISSKYYLESESVFLNQEYVKLKVIQYLLYCIVFMICKH